MKFLTTLNTVLLTANPNGLFSNWRGVISSWISSAIDQLIVPIGMLAAGGVLVYNLIKAGITYNRNRGDDITHNVVAVLICAVIIALLATKNSWWSFLVP